MAFQPSHLIRLRGLLAAEQQLAVALPEAERMAAQSRRFASVVPAAVARACSVAAIQGDTAVIYCSNGAAASRVRAQARGIARALSRAEAPVNALCVKIRADWAQPVPAEKHDLPARALQAFQTLDAQLPEGDLKIAVERLLARRRGAR